MQGSVSTPDPGSRALKLMAAAFATYERFASQAVPLPVQAAKASATAEASPRFESALAHSAILFERRSIIQA